MVDLEHMQGLQVVHSDEVCSPRFSQVLSECLEKLPPSGQERETYRPVDAVPVEHQGVISHWHAHEQKSIGLENLLQLNTR